MNNKDIRLDSALNACYSICLVLYSYTMTLDVALDQDQNFPTIGKTTTNITSTFSPNLPTTSSAGNMIYLANCKTSR